MSEYTFVEKPFLDQLAALGWNVINQGTEFPSDPSRSKRSSFREIVLKDIFFDSVREINQTDDGKTWLTDYQLEYLYDQITQQSSSSLLEANETVQKLLYRTQVEVNEVTGEVDPNVQLIDFHHPERNRFHAINQFRINTPGGVKECIIPDIVLFVNGMPLVVIECKEASQVQANPMYEAFTQLMRYSEQREETKQAGLWEGDPRLFYTNQFLIRTTGEEAQFGTITATDEEYFYPWRDIYPEKYREYTPPLGTERQQEILIQGMLPKETLLDIVRNCTVFMDVGKTKAKIVARYQQYRAMLKIVQRLRTGQTPEERSGVIWHTQGSGKSLTMVFIIRKLRMCDDLKDYKVCLINDRKDLEEQLSKTADLAGDSKVVISSTDELRKQLSGEKSNLNLIMVHKFNEVQQHAPVFLESAMEYIPQYNTFGIVNSSERILLMIDEAHRSQSGDLGDNLFEAFPYATRLAFTGTPLIEVKEDRQTKERFGQYIDKYKLQDAVEDGATIQILYEGKTADSAVSHKQEFDEKVDQLAREHIESQLRKTGNEEVLRRIAERENKSFDDLFAEKSEEEILAIKQKWGVSGDLLEADERIQAIAQDLVNHYIENILLNGFKAQVVCSSKMAAVKYKKYIDQAIADRLVWEEAKPVWDDEPSKLDADNTQNYRDDELCKKIAFLKSVVVVSSSGTNELAVIRNERNNAREVNAVSNFKKPFNYDDPEAINTGIAFLIVCDMLLTGFDAPIEQVMYIDKKVKDHNLLQTIARVNRVAKGKSRGFIVDYIGLANHLKKALSIYAAEDQEDVEGGLKDISSEIPILEERYRRLLNLFKNNMVERIQEFVEQKISDSKLEYQVLEHAVQVMENIKLRTNFEVYLKKFLQSMDIILPHSAANPYRVPAKRFGYILHCVKQHYKDDSLDISGAGQKVRKLIDEYLISLGVDPKIPPVELFSDRFITEVERNQSSRAKASEMEHAIRKHIRVKFEDDPALYTKLSEKLESLIKKYRDEWDELYKNLFDLRQEIQDGRKEEIKGISPKAAPFYDLIGTTIFGQDGIPINYESKIKELVNNIMKNLNDNIDIINFWNNAPAVSELKGKISDDILMTDIDDLINHCEKLVTEITALAKRRERDILS